MHRETGFVRDDRNESSLVAHQDHYHFLSEPQDVEEFDCQSYEFDDIDETSLNLFNGMKGSPQIFASYDRPGAEENHLFDIEIDELVLSE